MTITTPRLSSAERIERTLERKSNAQYRQTIQSARFNDKMVQEQDLEDEYADNALVAQAYELLSKGR